MTDKESHIVEFKQNWRDDYLKTVSAFANSKGGVLFVGIDDKWNEENLKKLDLNERQIKAVIYVKEKGKITLSAYKKILPDVSEKTLYRDLQNLVDKKLLRQIGEKKGRKYELL